MNADKPLTVQKPGRIMSRRLFAVVAALVLLAGITTSFLRVRSENSRMRADLLIQARLVADTVRPNELGKLSGSAADLDSPDYLHLKEHLSILHHANPKCRFLYFMGIRADGTVFFYVDSEPPDSRDYSPPGQVYTEAPEAYRKVFSSGREAVAGPVSDRWGTWVSALVPVLDPATQKPFAVLGMDIDAGTWNRDIAIQCIPPIAMTLIFETVVVFLFVAFRRADAARRRIARSEARLAASEERYRRIVETSNEGIWVGDAEHRTTYVNARMAEILGFTPEEMVGMPLAASWFEEDLADQRRITEDRRLGRAGSYERRARRKDGGSCWIHVSGAPVTDADGRFAGSFGMVTDITERRRAEEKVGALTRRLNHYLATSPAITYALAVDGERVSPAWVSENITPLLGYSVEEALRENWWADNLHPEDSGRVLAKMKELFKKGALTHEYRFRRKDGTWVWVRDELRFLEAAEGGRAEVVGAWVDVDEYKLLEAQFVQAQKMDAVGRLAGGVAHDFNNMLGVIGGYAELALLKISPADPLQEDLKEIKSAADRSAALTRQLLAFSRRQATLPRVVDLNRLLAETRKMLGRLVKEDVELSYTLAPAPWRVNVDPSQVDQVLMNLVVNSRDAIAGHGTIRIETRNAVIDEAYCRTHTYARPGDYVLLSVSDTGCGMDDPTMAKVFEPFFTTKPSGMGTGLGLSTVYGIVRQNGGFISVESAPGRGSTFEIHLPRFTGEDDAARPERRESFLDGSETILVVEDEASVRKLAVAALRGHGYRVIEAQTTADAILKVEQYAGDVHLLLTDVVMPGMSGKELQVQVQRRRPGIKTLFMSGYPSDVIARQGVIEEGVQFIQKPWSPRGLAEKVRAVLEG
jgi:PAS domain S-box-containing protein